jgi:hypothetical protein
MSKLTLKDEKTEPFKVNFLKTGSLSDDKILLSKKYIFFKQSHHKCLILRYLSLNTLKLKQINNTPSTILLITFCVKKL